MLPSRHIVVSLSLGAVVWAFTESLLAGVLCFLSGVLVDVDHLIEYVFHCGWKGFNLKEIYRTCKGMAEREGKGGFEKIYLLFHAVEIAVLLWIAFAFIKNIYLFSFALGYTVHLSMDAAVNTLKPRAYFVSFRIKNGFKITRFIR